MFCINEDRSTIYAKNNWYISYECKNVSTIRDYDNFQLINTNGKIFDLDDRIKNICNKHQINNFVNIDRTRKNADMMPDKFVCFDVTEDILNVIVFYAKSEKINSCICHPSRIVHSKNGHMHSYCYNILNDKIQIFQEHYVQLPSITTVYNSSYQMRTYYKNHIFIVWYQKNNPCDKIVGNDLTTTIIDFKNKKNIEIKNYYCACPNEENIDELKYLPLTNYIFNGTIWINKTKLFDLDDFVLLPETFDMGTNLKRHDVGVWSLNNRYFKKINTLCDKKDFCALLDNKNICQNYISDANNKTDLEYLLSEYNVNDTLTCDIFKCPRVQSVIQSINPILYQNEIFVAKTLSCNNTDEHKANMHIYCATNLGRIFYASCSNINKNQICKHSSNCTNCPIHTKQMKCIVTSVSLTDKFIELLSIVLPFCNDVKLIINIFEHYKIRSNMLENDSFLCATKFQINEDDRMCCIDHNRESCICHTILQHADIIKNVNNSDILVHKWVCVTNYGNIYYNDCDKYGGGPSTQNKKIINDIKLHDACIELLGDIIPYVSSIEPIDKIIKLCKSYSKSWFVTNDSHIAKTMTYEKMYLNECYKTNELHKTLKYFKIKNEELNKNNEELLNEYTDLKKILTDTIPLENQCCICFGFTRKNKFLQPCGHTQYCNRCINEIKSCAVCESNIEQVKSIY